VPVEVAQPSHVWQHIGQPGQDLVPFLSFLGDIAAAAVYLEHADGRQQKIACQDIEAPECLATLAQVDMYRVVLNTPRLFVEGGAE
jgi:hypothetical protein